MELYKKLNICDANTEKAMLYIKNKCLNNGVNKPTRFTHKNGITVIITPCTADPESANWDDVEFYLTDCDKAYFPGYFELKHVANTLLNLNEVIAENEKEKMRLARLKEQIETMPDGEDKRYQFQLYSDAYKSCYGYRP